jgi:RNA polymerase sigma factor (sigma-70 family)
MNKDERFEAIYRHNYGFVYRLFRACRVSDDESHDFAQDTFKRLYEKFDQFRGIDGNVKGFLRKIAMTVLLNSIRDRKAAKRGPVPLSIDAPDFSAEPAAPEGPGLAEREQQQLRSKRLRGAVAELSDAQRQCLTLRVKGFKYEEISEALKITMDAVRSRLRDAKKHLRARLGDDDAEK